tara:strand:- start:1607 stop:2020 length:414 start_codon:yes stop_codon:yes gene_type:complete
MSRKLGAIQVVCAAMYRKSTLLSAFVLLLFTSIGDVHGHYCLDGNEPAVSFHYENFEGHPEHQDEQEHSDYESELNLKPTLNKLKLLNDFLISTTDNVVVIYSLSLSDNFIIETDASFGNSEIFELTPPLRAPPQLA